MNILIVDDHELVRNGLTRIIIEEFPSSRITEVSNGMHAEKIARSEILDLIILDISLPDKSGLDILKQLRAESIKTPILIVSMYPESPYALRVLKSGGNGYIAKDCLRADFINAIRTIINGKKYISHELAEKIATRFDSVFEKDDLELVSDRELQVLRLMASGKTISIIAQELNLSITTISTYRQRLLDKLQLHNNAELTVYAINNKLV